MLANSITFYRNSFVSFNTAPSDPISTLLFNDGLYDPENQVELMWSVIVV